MHFLNVLSLVACLFTIALGQNLTLYDQIKSHNATTFLRLIEKEGLASILQNPSDGPYTLLVPTDKAFAKLPPDDLHRVEHNSQALQEVIQYHLIHGANLEHDFLFGRHYFLKSKNGHVVRVYRSATGTHFNQATAVKSDIQASNGVMYLINSVLDVPEGTVVDILGNIAYNTSDFLHLIKLARLQTNYANPTGLNRYTVFAPNNAAMAAMPAAHLEAIKNDTTNLRMFIEYHVHSGTMHIGTVEKHHTIRTTLPNHNIAVTPDTTGDVLLDHIAHITLSDIEAENGVVHVIDHVLMPQILTPIIG
ncbi:hypothetical protein ACF0H5_010424 [Mactra antiquata]